MSGLGDPAPWWRRPETSRWAAAAYVLLGLAYLVFALVAGRPFAWALGGLYAVGGVIWFLRGGTSFDGHVLRVPGRFLARRRVPVHDLTAFALPHRFAVTLQPSAVLRSGERLLLREADAASVRGWAEAAGIPLIRDSSPDHHPPLPLP